jgi:PAS domain S-box-containing protein
MIEAGPLARPCVMRPSILERYGFAVVAVGAALLYKLLLSPILDEPEPFLLFSLAILASAWRGGWGPGLFAAVASLLAADYFLLEPRFALGPAEAGQAVRLGLFALEALGLTWIAARAHHALRAVNDPERARAASDARARADRMRRLLDTGPAAVVGMDEAGTVVFWNARAARMFGWTEEDVLGRDLAGLVVPTAERDAWRAERERFLKVGEGAPAGRREMRLLRNDRSAVRVDALVVPEKVDDAWQFTLFLEDVTHRAQAEEALRREAAFAACLATSIAPGVAAVDAEGRVTFLNPAAEHLLGVKGEAVQGQPLHEVVHGREPHGDGEGAGECPLAIRLRAGEGVGEEGDTFRSADGAVVPVRWVASPIQGGAPGAVIVFEDDTRRRESERRGQEELAREQQARREAETSARVRDEFMATLSHELRTPLSAIVGWAHLLRSGNLEPADQARAVETIDRSAKSQAQLIADIFDVSSIITGKLRLTPEPVALRPVVATAVDTVRPAAEAKGVRIEVQVDDGAARVNGDANRLQQIVWNLVSNAVKFTPRGGAVHVRQAAEGDAAVLEVRDEGRGIRSEFLPHVFDRFRQAEEGREASQGGLGLGLAIVRHLVELHGGTVQAASAGEGQGAVFTVRLPLLPAGSAEPERPSDTAAAGAPRQPSLEGVRVLVVDDDADVRGMMETVLSERGAQVTAAASAGEALDSVAREAPDVLVSDLAMPEMDGYALLRELRGRPETPRIPAAAVTAYARTEDRRQALLAGFQMHVAKPIEPDELVAVVASLAGKTGPDRT